MTNKKGPGLLVIGGPSCAGKSPLCKAARKHHPELLADYKELVFYHSRAKRPHEVDGEDYHFRTRQELKAMRDDDGTLVWEVHDDLQAIEVGKFEEKLDSTRVLYEGNPQMALDLCERARQGGIEVVSCFLSPLSESEVCAWQKETGASFEGRITEMMRQRLLRRTQRQKAFMALPELQDIERRASDASDDLRKAHEFGYVIVNHDGEDSDHWSLASQPIGDAARAMEALCAALRGESHSNLETWPETLIRA